MDSKVRLIWTLSGYKVPHCNWDGYRPYANAAMIAHDLFEHRPNDLGGADGELRALGAGIRFNDMYIYKMSKMNGLEAQPVVDYEKGLGHEAVLETLFEATAKSDLKVVAQKIIPILRDMDIERTTDHVEALLRDGLKFAKRYTKTAHRRIRETDFVFHHNRMDELTVDMKTGRLTDIKTKTLPYTVIGENK